MFGPVVAVVATEIKDKKTVMVLIFIKNKTVISQSSRNMYADFSFLLLLMSL